MGCEVCQTTLSGLVFGLGSLISFILFSFLNIILVTIKLVIEKIKLKY